MVIRLKELHFNINPFGHGGEKREAQIDEALRNAGIQFTDLNIATLGLQYSRLEKIKLLLKYYTIAAPLVWKLQKSLNTSQIFEELMRISYHYHYLKQQEIVRKGKVLLWSNTYPNLWFIPDLFKKAFGIKVIGLPHNIESLVPNQHLGYFRKEKKWLYEEIDYLSNCDKVYCIATEDEWLLKLSGADAEFLPYYPTRELSDSLLKIREKRKDVSNGEFVGFLILGSATNPPTYLGMDELLKFLTSRPEITAKHKFIVAGFGTEVLKERYPSRNIDFLGAVSNEKLMELLTTCKGAVINQAVSTGALTKIQEYLYAGIPMLINHYSARTYYNVPGLQVFKSLEDVGKMLETSNNTEPVIVTDSCQSLVQQIHRFLN